MPNPRLKPQPLPDFDRYAVDFDDSGRPWCFHLFWRDVEVANVRLEYHADGYVNKAALRAGKGKQRYISLKDLSNIPFFTTYIHKISAIESVETVESTERVNLMTAGMVETGVIKDGGFESAGLTSWRFLLANAGDVFVTTETPHKGSYCLQMQGQIRTIFQEVPPYYGDELVFGMYALSPVAGGVGLLMGVIFEDGTNETHTQVFAAADTYEFWLFAPTTHKRVQYFYIYLGATTAPYIRIDDVVGIVSAYRTYKRANGSCATNGNNTIIAAVAGMKIKVYDYSLQAEGTVVATFQNGAGGAQVGQRWSFQAREGKLKHGIPPLSPHDFETAATTLLNLSLSAAIQVNYEIIYTDTDAA